MNISEQEAQELLKTHSVDVSHNHKDERPYNSPSRVTERKLNKLGEWIDKELNQSNPIQALSRLSPEKMERLRRELDNEKALSLVVNPKRNKYGAIRTWSELCQRTFDSKAECLRGEELYLMDKAGKIYELEYQVKFTLCEKPRITYTADFRYRSVNGSQLITEDVKGVMTRDTRTKLAWLKQQQGIDVVIVK